MNRLFNWLAVMTADGRKAWAFFSILIFCGIMTTYASVALYLVRANVVYVFGLGLAAHVQLGIAITGLIAFFVRRDVVITRDSVSIKDAPHPEEETDDVQHTDK
jgi:hypothetical protein